MVYDYSHYAYRDMPLEETVRTALPYTAHVVVKDAVREGDRVVSETAARTAKATAVLKRSPTTADQR